MRPSADGKLRLDLGCGVKRRPGTIGVDIDPRASSDLRFDLDRYPWPLRDGAATEIVASHVIEHVQDVPAFMSEIHRVLEKNGRVLIRTPYFSCWRGWADPTHMRQLSLMTMEHFTDADDRTRLSRGRFELIRAELTFDRSMKNLLPRWIARRWPKAYERHWAFLFPGRTIVFELEAV
jgi:SAM-dependent methyltransferase